MRRHIAKLLFMLVGLVVCFSCSDNEQVSSNVIGVTTPKYSLTNKVGASLSVSIKALKPVDADVDVPVVFNGAEEGVDFSASEKVFHLKKGETEAQITITRLRVERTKNMLMVLQTPSNARLGIMSYSQIDLVGANVYSFETSSDVLTLKKSYNIELRSDVGARFSFNDTTRISLEVDAASTAVEGEHFKFENGAKQAVFVPGSSTGTVTLEFLKLEAGKDNIILKVADSEGMIAGSNPSISIKIVGATSFSGTWAFKEVSNYQWLRDNIGGDTKVLFDGTAANDYFTFTASGKNYTFTPHFTGGLQNYFTAAGTATEAGKSREYFQELASGRPPRYELSMFKFDNINAAFSATDKDLKTIRVGFRLILDSKTKQELLEMTINDYAPTENTKAMDWGETWKGTYETLRASGDTPVMRSAPIRIHFTKVP